MAQLEGALLIELFGVDSNDIPFAQGNIDKNTTIVAKELAEYTNDHQDFYFSQSPDSIFVHTSNGGALISHIKRSARYMRFIPSEALTNFFASFAHSLTHIEPGHMFFESSHMVEFYLAQTMIAQKTTLVNATSYSYNPTMTSVLPHCDISTIG